MSAPATAAPTPATDPALAATAGPRRGRRPRALTAVGVAVLLLAFAAAFFPTLFTSVDPQLAVPADRLQPPSGRHWFGTDQLGRDQFARIVHGARASLGSAAIAVAIALVAGTALGLVAGFLGGVVDAAVMRLLEVVLAIPPLLLALALVSALGFGTVNVAVAVGVVSTAAFARLVRGEVLRIRSMAFVEVARSAGFGRASVLRRHVLPHTLGPVLVLATLEFGTALLAISTLSFLGFGTPPPAPEWGSLVSAGRGFLGTAWWMSAMPGLVIAVVTLTVNQLAHSVEGGRR
ncbi:ABC transporter permease [Pseudonocardia kongjuensis]|uniref:ABC transporter permease n=1 Tax=Pseudonocardia kongjuensis TaxID=102227 RepID=A0ABN1XJW8_9PSEU